MSRTNILEKVQELFMKYGLKSVSMDDISRNLGISKKTLYQCVDNKRDLIQKVFQKHIEEEEAAIREIVANSKDAVDEMIEIARFVTALLREVSPTTLYDMQKYYGDIWGMMEALHQDHIYTVIKTNLDRGIAEGLYRKDLNTDIIAKLYVGKTLLIVDEDVFPLKDYNKEKLYLEYVHYHLHGIALPKGLKLFEKYTK
jgi:AcrR family transcriptional regulator